MDTTTVNPNFNYQYCANRLPCGYCRLMSSMCPLQPNVITYGPTCVGSDSVSSGKTNGTVSAWNSDEDS